MNPAIISLIILIITIILFIARPIPNAATACLGCILFVIFGICSVTEAFSGFSNSIVILVFGMSIVGIAMQETGVSKLIGEKVTQLSKKSEKLFIFIAGLTSALLSTFLSNTSVIAIFLPIIASVSQSNPKMKRLNLTLPVTLGAMFGGVCTLVGSTPQLTANGILLEMCNLELKMFDYILPGVILCAVYLLYIEFIGFRLGNKIWGDRVLENEMTINKVETESTKVDKKKVIILLIIFAFTIVSFIGAWISTEMTAVISALLCIITGCVKQKSIIKKMDWSVVFILAGCLGIAKGLAKGGVGELIGNGITTILNQNVPPIIIFAIFVIATMLVSNFITNSTAVVIFLPVALSLCNSLGLNPITFTLGIVYAANLTYSTPLANAQTAMTLVAGYKFSDYIKYTWPLAVLVFVTIVLVVPLIFPF